jgi:hypothetical protein
LPSKGEALSSIPSTDERERENKTEFENQVKVLGKGTYLFAWMIEGTRYIKRNRDIRQK